MLKHHRGYGKEEMMKRFLDVDESKEEYKFQTPKFQVEEVVQESPKEARETQEDSEKPPTKAEVYPKLLPSRLYPFRTTPTAL